jgi:hypothetical protein
MIGHHDVVLNVRHAWARRRHELFHDEFMIVALAHQLLLGAMPEPGHRPPLPILVDEGEDIA